MHGRATAARSVASFSRPKPSGCTQRTDRGFPCPPHRPPPIRHYLIIGELPVLHGTIRARSSLRSRRAQVRLLVSTSASQPSMLIVLPTWHVAECGLCRSSLMPSMPPRKYRQSRRAARYGSQFSPFLLGYHIISSGPDCSPLLPSPSHAIPTNVPLFSPLVYRVQSQHNCNNHRLMCNMCNSDSDIGH